MTLLQFGFLVGVLIGVMSVVIIWRAVDRRLTAFRSYPAPTIYDWATEGHLSDADWDYIWIATGFIGLVVSICLLVPEIVLGFEGLS